VSIEEKHKRDHMFYSHAATSWYLYWGRGKTVDLQIELFWRIYSSKEMVIRWRVQEISRGTLDKRESYALGSLATVFQTGLYAILACFDYCRSAHMHNMTICMCYDRNATLLALPSFKISSKILHHCWLSLQELSYNNRRSLFLDTRSLQYWGQWGGWQELTRIPISVSFNCPKYTLITESEKDNAIASKFSLAHENSLHSDESIVQDSCSALNSDVFSDDSSSYTSPRGIKNIIKKLKNGNRVATVFLIFIYRWFSVKSTILYIDLS
jgi:hypothetical protein